MTDPDFHDSGTRLPIMVLLILKHSADNYPFTDIHGQLSEFRATHRIAFINLQNLLIEAAG